MPQIKSESSAADSEHISGALKDYGKPNRNTLNLSVFSDDGQQPQKKRRVDVLDISSIEKKLDEIRNKVDSKLTIQNQSTDESSTSRRKTNKNGKATTPATDMQQQNSSKGGDFDYSKVDFKKFQGGSQRPQPNNQFKSKFHGKVNNAATCRTCELRCKYFIRSISIFRGRTTRPINSSIKCFRSATSAKRNEPYTNKSCFFRWILFRLVKYVFLSWEKKITKYNSNLNWCRAHGFFYSFRHQFSVSHSAHRLLVVLGSLTATMVHWCRSIRMPVRSNEKK